MPEPLRVAFLGCGFITRVHSQHLQHLRQDLTFAYASRDRARAEDSETFQSTIRKFTSPVHQNTSAKQPEHLPRCRIAYPRYQRRQGIRSKIRYGLLSVLPPFRKDPLAQSSALVPRLIIPRHESPDQSRAEYCQSDQPQFAPPVHVTD
jgi:hypothetical protein